MPGLKGLSHPVTDFRSTRALANSCTWLPLGCCGGSGHLDTLCVQPGLGPEAAWVLSGNASQSTVVPSWDQAGWSSSLLFLYFVPGFWYLDLMCNNLILISSSV